MTTPTSNEKLGMVALLVRCILTIIALIMIVIGTVSIILGFSYKWPDAHPSGAIFFVGGWILLGIEQLAWHLRRVPKIPDERP